MFAVACEARAQVRIGGSLMTVVSRKGYCPHFKEVMDLSDCYFCFFKKIATDETNLMQKVSTNKNDLTNSKIEGV